MMYGTVLRAVRDPDFVVMVVQHPCVNPLSPNPAHPEHFAVVTVLAGHPKFKTPPVGTNWGMTGHTARLQMYTYQNTPLGEPNYEVIA